MAVVGGHEQGSCLPRARCIDVCPALEQLLRGCFMPLMEWKHPPSVKLFFLVLLLQVFRSLTAVYAGRVLFIYLGVRSWPALCCTWYPCVRTLQLPPKLAWVPQRNAHKCAASAAI